MNTFRYHSSHWGAFRAYPEGEGFRVEPFEGDADPSPLLKNVEGAARHPARLGKPLVRRGYLADGPGPDSRRGQDDHVEVDWDVALDLAARELKRLGAGAGQKGGTPAPGEQVFGGSYGWSSAGRFHHAQSQVHRFLNMAFGGYVRSVDTYSSAAGAVILDMVCMDSDQMWKEGRDWAQIADHSELVIAFGGLPLRNLAVAAGGATEHPQAGALRRAAARGCRFVSVSPIADDSQGVEGVSRIAPRPHTDVALMLGMAHVLLTTGQVDEGYLATHTVGWDRLRAYLTGEEDGVAKTPDWAAAITGVEAETITDLAYRAAGARTHITVNFSLQRAENGEQPVWMALTLAAMLGQMGAPGGGFSYGLASGGNMGRTPAAVPLPTLPQGKNGIDRFIPASRIADLLLTPGAPFTYRGESHLYPDIRLVYWAGGNPFHHHQDLSRLTRALAAPDTIIVHESVGTAMARHADIVFPVTLTVEREDIGASANDPRMLPMQRLIAPYGETRDDFDVFCALSERIGCLDAFAEGRSARAWQAHMFDRTRDAMIAMGVDCPDFDSLMAGALVDLPLSDDPGAFARFNQDPVAHPLPTPSGRIEIWSDRVAASGLPGHPAWLAPQEWLGAPLARDYPFQLVSNQPRGRLHSQLDFGAHSMSTKQAGREVARMNPADAQTLGIAEGDVIRVFNARGGLLAGVATDAGIAPGILQLSTGSWYAPVDLPGVGLTCVNGNPNAVTADRGTSALSNGCSGQLCLVAVERWTGEVPPAVPHAENLPRGA